MFLLVSLNLFVDRVESDCISLTRGFSFKIQDYAPHTYTYLVCMCIYIVKSGIRLKLARKYKYFKVSWIDILSVDHRLV